MKTAVEWLDEKLQDTMYFVYGYTDGVRKVTIPLEDYMRLKQEALEMEKQQIERDFINGYKNADVPLNHKLLDEYYTSTYGSDEYPEIEGTMAICNDIISSQTDHNLPKEIKKDSFGDISSQTETYGSKDITLQNNPQSKVITELSDDEIKPKHKVGKFIIEAIKEKIARTSSQTERRYSEEDLISFAHFYFKEEFNSTMETSKSTDEVLQEWKQFKKK